MTTKNDRIGCGGYLDVPRYYNVSLNVCIKFYIFVIQFILQGKEYM